jgi:tetratricopeptide (TPR) repeat protein
LNVSNAPVQYRRHALLKIGELSLARTNFAGAMDTMQRFLMQFPADSAADAALLALGELELAQHLSGGGTNRMESATNNFCERALGHFETLLRDFPNSALAGKALLNKGWCLWSEGNYAASEAAFAQAVERLPFSEDQAIARFKWADAQFMRTNFYGALNNYHFLTTYYAAVPGVKENLLEQVLYQTVRASLNVNDLDSATNALGKILDWYPVIAASCMSDRDSPRAATRLGHGGCFPTFRRAGRRPLSCRRRVWRSPAPTNARGTGARRSRITMNGS